MAQRVIPLLGMTAGPSPGCYTSDQLSGKVQGKAMKDGPNIWVPSTHVNDTDEGPDSWLLSGAGLVVVLSCGVNQIMKNLNLSLFSPSPIYPFFPPVILPSK